MKLYYPVIFLKEDDGRYLVSFSDVPEAITCGNDFENIDIITTDVSFISIKKIIDKIYQEQIKVDLICLIKPQFECGKELADKYKGIILNKSIHISIIKDIINYFKQKDFYIKALDSSPIRGGDGNIEYVSYFSNKDNGIKSINIEEIVKKAFKEQKSK